MLIADSVEDDGEEAVLAARDAPAHGRTHPLRTPHARGSARELLADVAPVVLVNRAPHPGTPAVTADYRSALREIIEHLHGLGHRRFAYLSGSPRSASNAARLAALEDARAAHPDTTIVELSGGVDFDAGAAALDAVLATGATAVLAFNDLVAMGLLSAAGERGIRVPEDLSIAGFDDIPFARFTSPPLTTAAVPAAELGARAWAAMHDLLDGREPEPLQTFTPEVVLRGSTGAPSILTRPRLARARVLP